MVKFFFRFSALVIAILVIRCADRKQPLEVGPPILPEKRLNAAFLVIDGIYNSELTAPMDVLQHTAFHMDKGIQVFTVAPTRDTLTTLEGLRIIPDYSFTADSLPAIDILIVPGAKHSKDSDLEDVSLLNFVKKVKRQAAYVISFRDGAFVLAKAGILDLHECTTFSGDVELFRKAFPQLKVHENVSFVHDRQVITSEGGAKSYEPALYLVELLYGKTVSGGIAKGLVIDWDIARVPAVLTKR